MSDPDVIAYLFPPEGQGRDGAKETISMAANESRFLPARRHNDAIKPAPDSSSLFVREATEQPEEVDDLERLPCLVVRFSNPPKSRLGIVAGRSPQADLVLLDSKGVSSYHFALTFDEEKHLVVKDLDSAVGTQVIYDGEIGERGHGIAWSACGPSLVKGKVPVIKVVRDLQFRLVVPDHDITSRTYLDNVARFLEGAAPAEDLFLDMKITSRAPTELPTPGEAHAPSPQKPGRILWQKELGRGGFAVVKYVWDVTSRAEYALKEPLRKNKGDWEREAKILKSISHDNIVTLKHAVFDSGPQLYFEYVKGGSLDRYKCTTPFQRAQATIQLLDGLAYIHGKLLAHRDVKPENILVECWHSNRVHVKLADFGLSKQSDDLKTFCGTARYVAPEIFCTHLANSKKPKDIVKYDQLVDIWSLAVVLAWLECGKLPETGNAAEFRENYEYSGNAWGDKMVEFVQGYQTPHGTNDLLSFVLDDMLVVDPEKRQPARICHKKALRLFGGATSGEERDPSTPRAVSAGVTSSSNDSAASEASTVLPCPRVGQDNGQSSELSVSRAPQLVSESLIVDRTENGSGLVDDLLKMAPSDMSKFERSDAPSPDTVKYNSVVGSKLWDIGATTGVRGSVTRLEESKSAQRGAARDEDDGDARAVVSPSQHRKRSSTGHLLSELIDQEPEDGGSKRSKVWIVESPA